MRNLLQNYNVYDDTSVPSGWTVPVYKDRFKSDTYQQLDPNSPAVVYRDNRPLARSMKTPWFDANPSSFTVSTGGPRAVTVIGWLVTNPYNG